MENKIIEEIEKEIFKMMFKYGGDYYGAKILSEFMDIIKKEKCPTTSEKD